MSYTQQFANDLSERMIRYSIFTTEIILNLLLLNIFYSQRWFVLPVGITPIEMYVFGSLSYLACCTRIGTVTHFPLSRPDQILVHSFSIAIAYSLLTTGLLLITKDAIHPVHAVMSYYFAVLFFILLNRLVWRKGLQAWRRCSSVMQRVVYVGDLGIASDLFLKMNQDRSTGYCIVGYFADQPDVDIAKDVPYLGTPNEVVGWLRKHEGQIDQLYTTLYSNHQQSAAILQACENSMVHFFVIPSYRTYIRHSMHFELMYGVPVLSLRREPLNSFPNRLLKRSFDLLCSTLFLVTIFPILYVIIGIAIKMSSPGPVFFKQKRSGLNGKEFLCYKFRSMRVNDQCDTLQATRHDPRKTRIGEFLRHTNLDELPQFINVFRGEMTMVGPRPHMLKHTEQYSAIIDKYMVRHLVKPGITGWAQVTGFRGETKELWQMEGRVKADIWYIEHWTFILDLYIMYLTIKNVVVGEKQAY